MRKAVWFILLLILCAIWKWLPAVREVMKYEDEVKKIEDEIMKEHAAAVAKGKATDTLLGHWKDQADSRHLIVFGKENGDQFFWAEVPGALWTKTFGDDHRTDSTVFDGRFWIVDSKTIEFTTEIRRVQVEWEYRSSSGVLLLRWPKSSWRSYKRWQGK